MIITIKGAFPGLNEWVDANRRRKGNWSAGNAMKQRDQNIIAWQLPGFRTSRPVRLEYKFYCPDRRKDKDNVAGYFHKIFQDALVQMHCIPDDGWNNIDSFTDEFYVDSKNPRVEITVKEIGDGHTKTNDSGLHERTRKHHKP